MYKFAIVDDDINIGKRWEAELKRSFSKENIEIECDVFQGGNRMLSLLKENYHYDVFFLDIEMPEINGLDLCKRIKELSPNAVVIFVSVMESLVFDSFELQPFRFILKNHFEESLGKLIPALKEKLNSDVMNRLTIVENGTDDIYSFNVDKILYAEASLRNCKIVTEDGETVLQLHFQELETLLEAHHFIKPHRSYLVNPKKIYYIGNSYVILTNKTEIPLSRARKDAFKQEYIGISI